MMQIWKFFYTQKTTRNYSDGQIFYRLIKRNHKGSETYPIYAEYS